MFRADLHTHTTCSDGSLTPVELIAAAKKSDLSALSITDHDTIDAYQTAIPAAKGAGLRLGAGAEFSCLFEEMSVHVLAYDFDLTHPAIHDLCKEHQLRRLHRNRSILRSLAQHNMPISEEELSQFHGTLGRPHIARLMVEKGYVMTLREAFNRFIGDEAPCFHRGASFTVPQTIGVIHQAGGKAFLAHPHLLSSRKSTRNLLHLPFDGIECHYAKIPPDQERPWLKIAKEKGWLISGGSDFHGSAKEYIPLGCSWVDEAHFKKIFQRPLT